MHAVPNNMRGRKGGKLLPGGRWRDATTYFSLTEGYSINVGTACMCAILSERVNGSNKLALALLLTAHRPPINCWFLSSPVFGVSFFFLVARKRCPPRPPDRTRTSITMAVRRGSSSSILAAAKLVAIGALSVASVQGHAIANRGHLRRGLQEATSTVDYIFAYKGTPLVDGQVDGEPLQVCAVQLPL